MKANNKYIVLIIRRHYGEIDWILPLIYKLTKDLKLITIFNNQNSFESLSKNKALFNLWKKKCDKFYIVKKYDRIFYKLSHKILITLKLNKLRLFGQIENFFIKNTFNFSKFLKQNQINKQEIKIIFTPINNLSSLPAIFKNNLPHVKLIRFPESQWINTINNISYIKNYSDKFTDSYLIPKEQNANFFFGAKITNSIKKKIINCKFLKYESWWIKKLNFTDKIDKNLITIFTRPPSNSTLTKESYNYYIKTIFKVLSKFKNVKVIFKVHPNIIENNMIKNCAKIFKIHPNISENNMIKNCAKSFKSVDWKIDTNHPMVLASKSNFCISLLTSACLDCLAVKKTVIEFFDYTKEKNKIGAVFSKSKKKWISIYSKKKLVKSAINEKELDFAIKHNFSKKNIKFLKSNNNFLNLIKYGLNSQNIAKKILKLAMDN